MCHQANRLAERDGRPLYLLNISAWCGGKRPLTPEPHNIFRRGVEGSALYLLNHLCVSLQAWCGGARALSTEPPVRVSPGVVRRARSPEGSAVMESQHQPLKCVLESGGQGSCNPDWDPPINTSLNKSWALLIKGATFSTGYTDRIARTEREHSENTPRTQKKTQPEYREQRERT
ncbi:hypothetical protein RRG08_015990 [Elysia crispata]|uniref:Uncharacterized protein n=1 Tax=Elysia crispata TaxID=231223 RepID=A0AAE0YDT5_9GAST|nr:hypothetical protein RRG08_015990 [Elysia crispata]